MKKLSLVFGLMFILSGLAVAQDGHDYKSRNHKFHKNNKAKTEVKNMVATNSERDHDLDYRQRNSKFHKHQDETLLVHNKEKIEYDYRAMNRKFQKGQLARLSEIQKQDTTLTKGKE
jgi:hypothetical protein